MFALKEYCVLEDRSMLEMLEPLPKEKAQSFVTRVLASNILSWNLKPGEQLEEVRLCDVFGVSRTPIREALIKLSQNNMVTIYPQRGTFVSMLNPSLITQAQYLRLRVEPDLAAMACLKRTQKDLDQMRENIAIMRSYEKDANFRPFQCDLEFHGLIYSICDMDFLKSTAENMSVHLNRMRRLCTHDSGYQKTIQFHEQIYQSILNQNPEVARSNMILHLSGTLEDLTALQEKFPQYFL